MGQRSTCDNTAAPAVADECINDDWNPNDKRFLRFYEADDEYLLINELGIYGAQAETLADEIRLNISRGICYSLFVDNVILAIAGILVARAGIGELWSASTKEVDRNPKFYYKASKWGIEDGFNRLNLRRLQTTCHIKDHVSYNWQIRLGFKFEGIMKSYNDDGSDAVRMAIICGQRKTPGTD